MQKWAILILLLGTLAGKAQSTVVLDTTYASLDDLWAQFEGKVVYVDFWASWCRPCLEMMPASKQLQQQWADEDSLVFLFLGYRDKRDHWSAAIKRLGLTGFHYWLTPAQTQQARKIFNITAIPHYALIGKDGKIAYLQTLDPTFPGLEKDFKTLLEE